MKFICSFLILAGVFALNDAFPSSSDDQDHMRLIRDQMILEDLREMTANRDTSDCSAKYLNDLSGLLTNYNTDLKNCDNAEQNAIDAINKDTSTKIEEFNKSITGTCSTNCSSDSAEDNLSCISDETSQSSRLMSEISVAASTLKVEMLKAIDDARGIKNVCTQVAYSTYSNQSQVVEDAFKKCINQKEAAQSDN